MNPGSVITLPPTDVAYLNTSHPGWHVLRDGAASWLVLPEYVLPEGYNHRVATALVRIEPSYPDTQIDMVFFNPLLARSDGKAIGATGGRRTVNGTSFQQWSRHRTRHNPWRPGVDDIESHMLLVRHWLEREFDK